MRRTTLGALGLAVMAMATTTNALDITTDGDWSDWFSYDGTTSEYWSQSSAINTLLSPDIRYANDNEWDANGGQPYDIEQIFYYYEDFDVNEVSGGVLHVGMVSGYDPDDEYEAGDLFIDLGCESGDCDNDYDLAVRTDPFDSDYEDVWENDGWRTRDSYYDDHADPYRVKENRRGADHVGEADVAWGYHNGVTHRWYWHEWTTYSHTFMEVAVELDGLQELEIIEGGIGLHWTMECGNDYIEVCDDDPLSSYPPPPPPPPAAPPVPEPATMVLLGMGVAGMALRARRPRC